MLKNPGLKDTFMRTSVNNDYSRGGDKARADQTQPFIDQAKQCFPKPAQTQTNEEGQEEDAKQEELSTIGNLPDLRSDSKIYEWAGISFGEYDTMLLQKNLQKLASSSGATQLRLWGKIHGTEKDYFIAEGSLEAGGEGEEEPVEGMENRGSGVNKYVYWACNGSLGEWTQLPDLKPQDIINSRQIKHTFSGDLNRLLYTNPFFFQKEAVYLRSQIARITHSTTLIPKGLFRLNEENPREIEENRPEDEEQEYKPPAT